MAALIGLGYYLARHEDRQVQQEVDQPRRLAPVEQIAQQSVLLRADARKRRDLGKQRIEQSGAHRSPLHTTHVMRARKPQKAANEG